MSSSCSSPPTLRPERAWIAAEVRRRLEQHHRDIGFGHARSQRQADRPLVDHLLASGELVQLGPPSGQRHQYFRWSRPTEQIRPAVAAFRDWLLGERQGQD